MMTHARRPRVHVIYARRDGRLRRRKIFVYDTRVMILSIYIFPSAVGDGGVDRFTHTHIFTLNIYRLDGGGRSRRRKKKKCNNNNGEEKYPR